MAVMFIDGFDHLSSSQMWMKGWATPTLTNGTSLMSYSMITGRLGTGQAVRITSDGNWQGLAVRAWVNLPFTLTSFVIGIALRPDSVMHDNAGVLGVSFATTSGTTIARVGVTSAVGGYVYRLLNGAGSVLATGTTLINPNTWHYLETKVVVHASTGSVELRLDGASTAEASASGLNLGSTGLGRVYVGSPSEGYYAHSIDFDDLYVLDASGSDAPRNTFLGEVRVETLRPSANGAYAQFTPSAGSNYQNVDDTTSHDSDATYNSSSTIGHIDSFVPSSPSETFGQVRAIQTSTVFRKSNAGYRRLAPFIRHTESEAVGPDFSPMIAQYELGRYVYDTTPLGSEWSAAAIMLTEFGYKVTG